MRPLFPRVSLRQLFLCMYFTGNSEGIFLDLSLFGSSNHEIARSAIRVDCLCDRIRIVSRHVSRTAGERVRCEVHAPVVSRTAILGAIPWGGAVSSGVVCDYSSRFRHKHLADRNRARCFQGRQLLPGNTATAGVLLRRHRRAQSLELSLGETYLVEPLDMVDQGDSVAKNRPTVRTSLPRAYRRSTWTIAPAPFYAPLPPRRPLVRARR